LSFYTGIVKNRIGGVIIIYNFAPINTNKARNRIPVFGEKVKKSLTGHRCEFQRGIGYPGWGLLINNEREYG
jgi:hypothetical protein